MNFAKQIEVSGLLNLTRVEKMSQCGDPNGNSVEVAVPGNETPLLLLCTRPERHNDFYKGSLNIYNSKLCT